MRGQAAPVTAPYSFIGNRKLTKEEGEDSVVVKHQEGYAIEIYRNITVLTLSDTITVWRIVAAVLLFLFFLHFSFFFFFTFFAIDRRIITCISVRIRKMRLLVAAKDLGLETGNECVY